MADPAAVAAALLLSAAMLLPDAPSGGPAAVVDDTRPAAAVPSVQARGGSWQWPITPKPAVLKQFGVGPFRWSPGHRGVDLASPPGSQVRAAGSGVVSFAGPLAGRGVVVLVHAGGLRTTYEPVQSAVQTGQRVTVGEVIGRLQAFGSHCAATTCLHWGALRGQIYLDPLSLLGRQAPPVLLPLIASVHIARPTYRIMGFKGYPRGMNHYVHGHADAVLRSHRTRTAQDSAAYLLPHLRPGQSLLDVGCGPGTITADLAERVAPGTVLAIDPSPAVVEQAAAHCRERGLRNVEVVVGDIYALDPARRRFDVVHAHQVLQHLPDPVEALRRMRALSTPGGLIAVRDADYAAMTWYPASPELEEWRALYRRLAAEAGGQPDAGRRLLAWARAAGFTEIAPSASTWCFATDQARTHWGGMWADRIVDSDIARQALASGAAQPGDLERLRAAWQRWAADPDGWFVIVHGELLCTTPPNRAHAPQGQI